MPDRDRGDEIVLLGGFAVWLGGIEVDPSHWRSRRAAAQLVARLALAPDRHLHRELVVDALWPDLDLTEANPRLHKAVHFARRALGADAMAWNGDILTLFPDRSIVVDAVVFEEAAGDALERRTGPDCVDAALRAYAGELLPNDRYASWTDPRREHLAHLHRQLLRVAGHWSELVALDPTDEVAHVAIMRAQLDRGDREACLAQFERLATVLDEELGVVPGREAMDLRANALAAPPIGPSPSPAKPEPPPPPAGQGRLPVQEIRFCRTADDLRLAYAVVGDGPPLVKAANWLSHLEYDWESAIWHHWLLGLTSRFRVLRYDERGCGLSDWNTTSFSVDAWVDDLAAVADAAGFDRFPLLGVSQGAAVAVEYAARHPERVSALVLYGGYVRGPLLRARTEEDRRAADLLPQLADLGWGMDEPSFRQVFTNRFMPGASRSSWDEFNELQRRTTSPSNAGHFMRAFNTIDVSSAAGRVACPTLVVHVRGDRLPPLDEGRELAALIPGSRFVSLDGENHLLLEDEPAWPRFLEEMDRFFADVGVS